MKRILAAVAIAAATFAGSAAAAPIVLSFEGIYPTYPGSNDVFVNGFYNGGTASNGTSGTNYGVTFSSNALAICLNSTTVFCSNGSRGGQGDPASAHTGLFFLTGAQTFVNVAAGFTTGFSFFYSAVNQPGSITVYDGLNGTGTALATLVLPLTSTGTCTAYNAQFCPFTAIGVTFAGTAESISFAGVANQIAFDDITIGSAVAGGGGSTTVPEPGSLALLGLGLAGLVITHRRRITRR